MKHQRRDVIYGNLTTYLLETKCLEDMEAPQHKKPPNPLTAIRWMYVYRYDGRSFSVAQLKPYQHPFSPFAYKHHSGFSEKFLHCVSIVGFRLWITESLQLAHQFNL